MTNTALTVYRLFLLRIRNFSDKSVEKIISRTMSNNVFFLIMPFMR